MLTNLRNKMRNVLPLIGVCFFSTNILAQGVCTINGIVKNRPQSKVLYLAPVNTDFRVNDYTCVPIVDSAFSYSFPVEQAQEYSLIFEDEYNKGAWMPTKFIAENANIEIVLNEEKKWMDNVVKGSGLTNRQKWCSDYPAELFGLRQLRAKLDSMDVSGAMYSESFLALIAEIKQAEDNKLKKDSLFNVLDKIERYSEAGLEFQNRYKEGSLLAQQWKIAELTRVVDVVGLAYLQELAYSVVYYKYKHIALDELREIYNTKYKSKFSDNPMAKNIEMYLSAVSVTGEAKYIDFVAPDMNGNSQQVSSLIEGKVAILDLWASWCGPCMRTSKALIPIYEKYKDKGLVIVGVAREKSDTKAMISAIERLKLPWINLAELNDQQNIWSRYGVGNGGGRVFLINQNGKIVMSDITSDSIDVLDSRLDEMLK